MDLCWQINISAFQYGIKVFRFTQNAPVFFQPRGVGGEGEMERLRVECNESDWGKMPQPRHQSIRWSWQRCSNVFTLAEAIIKKPLNEGAWVRNADMYVSMAGPASLVAQTIKKLPAMWENQVDRRSLEKGMEPHSSILVWRSPWTSAHQASLFLTISWSLPKHISIELVMPSNHLILCRPLLLRPPIPPSITVFSNESTLRMRWPKYWSFSFSIIPSKEHPGLISFRMDRLDLLAVQGILKSSPTPQFKNINSSVLSLLHSLTLTSICDYWKNHSLD